jgi:all-trans-8'-apo-beta-carotenal 15,15'-oxygenase
MPNTFATLLAAGSLTSTVVSSEFISPMRNTDMFHDPVILDGAVPIELSGTLIRNVPSLYDFGFHKVDHMFDALPSIVSISFESGKATFRRKMLRTPLVKNVMDNEMYNTVPLASSPHWPSLAKSLLTFEGIDLNNPITNVIMVNGSFAATNDVAIAWQQFEENCDTIEHIPPHVQAAKSGEFAASHPGYDPESRVWFNYVGPKSQNGMGPPTSPPYEYSLYSMDELSGEVKTLTSFYTQTRSMSHQLGVTRESVIWVETPYTTAMVPQTLWRGFTIFNMIEVQDKSPVFHVYDRTNGHIVSFETKDPAENHFYNGHIINSFEKTTDLLVLDVVTYVLADDAFGYFVDEIPKGTMAVTFRNTRVRRCLLSRSTKTYACETITDEPFEYPALLPADEMSEYQFVFGVSITSTSPYWNEIHKVDLHNHKVAARWSRPNFVVNEPRAAMLSDGRSVVILLANDVVMDKSYVLVLGTETLETVSMLELPTVIPFHPHGIWVDSGYGKEKSARGYRN